MTTVKNHSRKLSFLVAIFILLAGVFLGGYLVLKSGRVSAGQLDDILKGPAVDLAACDPDVADADKDSDKDGLKDWQEIQLYQSDACKTDSDNDGYLDGEEIASGYNPIIKAPGDELPGTAPKGPRPLPENLTKALSSALAQQVVSGKIDSFNQDGQILSAAELAKYPAIQQSIQQLMLAGDQLFAPEPIDDDRIKTTPDNSRAAIQKYAAEAAECPLCREPGVPQISESEIFLKAARDNDFSDLNRNLEIYQAFYEKLKTLTVPTDLLPVWKKQLAIFSGMIKIYQAVKEVDADPLKANLALQYYPTVVAQLSDWLQSLSDIIKTHR